MEPLLEFIVTIIVAVFCSDVAAFFAARRFQKKQAKRARLTAFQSLLNEVERIQKVVDHNCQLKMDDTIQPVTRMPMTALETAFVSGKEGVRASEELLQAVADYLVCADSINVFIDVYIALISSGTCVQQLQSGVEGSSYGSHIVQRIIKDSEQKLPSILKMLRSHLQEEINES